MINTLRNGGSDKIRLAWHLKIRSSNVWFFSFFGYKPRMLRLKNTLVFSVKRGRDMRGMWGYLCWWAGKFSGNS